MAFCEPKDFPEIIISSKMVTHHMSWTLKSIFASLLISLFLGDEGKWGEEE